VLLCKKLLEHIGLNPERLRLEWVSAGEGIRFANIMNEFGRQVEELGPLGTSEGIDRDSLKFRLEALAKIVPYIKLVQTERLRVPLKLRVSGESEENYKRFFSSDEVNRIVRETVLDKLAMSQILLLLRDKPLSTGKIAEILGLTPSEVSRHMNTSSRHGLVRYDVSQKCYALA
jgi:DNA-binding transcriptional ArsR family regulator